MSSPDRRVAVRPAEPGDAAAIGAVHAASRRATMPYLPEWVHGRSPDEVTAWVRDTLLPGNRAWVAEVAGGVVGYAVLEGDLLDHLYLLPDARRQGIGTALLDEVRRSSPAGVRLWVFEANVEAKAFYRRHGFRVVERTDGSANMEKLPDLLMGWAPE